MSTEAQIKTEFEQFRTKLPDLLDDLRGKWVVFRDGAVQSVHETHDAALQSAIATFGLNGAYVVAIVAEIEPKPITAAVMFGLH